MSKDKKLIPELRFPEFKSDGEWEKIKLKQSATFYRGLTYGQEDIADNGLLVLRSGNIQNDTLVLIKDLVHVQKDCPDDLKLMNGDVVICMSNGSKSLVGKNAEYRGEYSGNITVGAFCSIMRPKNRFTKYLLQSDSYQTFIALSIGGGNINNLKNSDLEEFECAVPKKNLEQQKIASCLSSLDEVITAHSQKLELLKDHKKGLMQNLFPQEGEQVPKYRFPEFNSPLVKIGFADLGDIKIGLTHKPEYISSGVPFLSSKNISNGYIDFINVQYISREKFESMPESTKPKLGDILFTRVGSNLGNPIVLEQDIEFGIFVSLGAFRVNKKANNFYMKYWMESDLFWKQVNQKVAGGAKDNLNSTWLREFELFIPSITEQQKIASCLSSLDALITAQAKKVEQLKLHKKGLMQRLFPKIID